MDDKINMKEDEELMDWGRIWELDGDLCRCRACRRAIIRSKKEQPMVHKDGCPNSVFLYPWHALHNLT